ncbi:hypothetical protein [Sediminibacterium goheungense]|uniref:Uncharacterized protein n=1 Tax=Sediminibacterium goheungense TaxID=1086393 RepID=A0A4R6IWK9_9BACT|nr:hypothetical protein [Sediminibacterium goheungense]TDO27103.1 hypothetical protein BC659_2422 [Sediminibacterium goheungense]
MKKVFTFVILMMGLSILSVSAQTEVKAVIVTSSNETLEGTIKDQMQKKGNIVFISSAGAKKLFAPSDITGFTINGVKYVSYANDFYKEVSTGSKAGLFIRVTDNSGKTIYNGAEPVVLATAEGKAGDYYLQIKSDGKFNLVSKKNFTEVMSALCADCLAIQSGLKSGQLTYTQIDKLVEQYNSCL